MDVDIAKQTAWLAKHRRADIARLHALRDQYVAKPSDHAPLEEALKLRAELRQAMAEQFEGEKLPCPPLLAALNFFPCYFAADGTPLPAEPASTAISATRRGVTPSRSERSSPSAITKSAGSANIRLTRPILTRGLRRN